MHSVQTYLHPLAYLLILITGMVLYGVTQNDTVSRRVDQIRFYQLVAYPTSPTDAAAAIKKTLDANWVVGTDDACWGTTYLTGTCLTKRQSAVTDIKAATNCDVYKSPMCGCISQMAKGIYMLNSTSSPVGKALSGLSTAAGPSKDALVKGLRSCMWLQHNNQMAVESGNYMARNMFLVLVIVLASFLNCLYVFYDLFTGESESYGSYYSYAKKWGLPAILILVAYTWGGVTESGTVYLLTWLLIPGLVLLFWYEMIERSIAVKPWLHPYYFVVVMGCVSVLGATENRILDWDKLYEYVILCNILGYIYVGMNALGYKHGESGAYNVLMSKPVQIALFRGIVAVTLCSSIYVFAPAVASCAKNYLFYMPVAFTLFAFVSCLYVNRLRLDPVYGDGVKGQVAHKVPVNQLYNSASNLLLITLIVFYYMRANSFVGRSTTDYYPTVSVQNNASYTWQNPILT